MSATLYVARDRRNRRRHDVGSVLCLRVVQEYLDDVSVVDCDASTRVPAYVRGTPTVVDEATGDMFTGHNAVQHLHSMAVASAAATVAGKGKVGGGKAVSAAAATTATTAAATTGGGDDLLPDAWQSSINDNDEHMDEPLGGAKLKADDLARLVPPRGGMSNGGG